MVEPTMWQMVQQFVGQVGFPIFVAVYLLVRVESTIKANTAALLDVAAAVRAVRDNCEFQSRGPKPR